MGGALLNATSLVEGQRRPASSAEGRRGVADEAVLLAGLASVVLESGALGTASQTGLFTAALIFVQMVVLRTGGAKIRRILTILARHLAPSAHFNPAVIFIRHCPCRTLLPAFLLVKMVPLSTRFACTVIETLLAIINTGDADSVGEAVTQRAGGEALALVED